MFVGPKHEFDKTPHHQPLIFPDHVTHANTHIRGARPVSAGFLWISKDRKIKLDMTRHSESLNLYPRQEDEKILQDWLDEQWSDTFAVTK